MDRFDYVIVGGGSAGCVLAHRLSAAPSVRVALIEAGADTPPGAVPAAILDSYPMPVFCGEAYIWPDLKAKATQHAAPRIYEQGRVMGGGSSINVQSANRGLPRDYDEWAANGAEGWSWRDVLPYFRKLERDVNFPGGELHGSGGPMPIRRIMPKDWPAFCHAFAKGLRANGFAELQDQNGEFGDGFFPGAFSNIDDKRVSTAIAYLDEATRKRPNLSVYANLRVERIVMEGAKALGVVAMAANGERLRFDAGEVVLSAGALQSPAMLMRAGIGDASQLVGMGIPCVADLPGVGRNLQDHPSLTFCHFLEPRFRMPLARRRASMMAARMSSGVAGCDESDLYLSSATRAAWHALGNRLGLFFLWCNRPYSRGRVQLASPDAAVAPRVDLNLLDDERDLQRLAAGVRMLARVVDASGLGRDSRDFFPAAFSPRVKALSRAGDGNALLTSMLGVLLDTPAPVRRLLIERFFTRGLKMAALIGDERALADFIRANVFGVWHASGTCRMGGAQDRYAVTDTEGRVRGTRGLRVVDASLMPRLPSANTNIPTIMIAEKIADAMVAQRGARAASLAAAH
ncbi:GMC family oxidoreductase N-terminal domain-containing protein [Paraburkholderia sp. CNPSo 3272]|uniref:GMC family oxidoreductase n=1 Tax=Paraburkholderia sp. CNPSo 3272 TaxID=2940931 RepID=UPI0020B88B9C|nr:GMC family oxidoreductase N-terminal domain-containing protein [Paraburkholderia sp. CNPSo 3272]MCP3725828.1 GMC family oxidoreductase N-terminal domain-containing protein [Paraburkholderia sp. CNPSo 3272]